jgi:hypothetical protein
MADISGNHVLSDLIANLLVFHMNESIGAIEDERDFLRVWRRRFRDIVIDEKTRLFSFLNATDLSGTVFLREIAELPPSSTWYKTHICTPYNPSHALSELETTVGGRLTDLRAQIHAAFTAYNDVLRQLFEVEERLSRNVQRIMVCEKSLGDVVLIPIDDPATALLDISIKEYVKALFEKFKIQDDYALFCRLYTQWNALRSVVLGRHIAAGDAEGGPYCSICTTEKICMVLLPCGHTFCNNCGHKQRSQCYLCRTTIQNRSRIYFA